MPVLPPRFDPLRSAYARVMAADPFLMAAAIAYNTFFAFVPLAFAGVAALSIIGSGPDGIARIEEMVSEGVPEQVADAIVSVVEEAQRAVGGMGTVVVAISLLVALWSGSRAVYAVQKSLRLIQGVDENRPFWKTRGLGVLFTIGAGAALVIGYPVLILGDWLTETLAELGLHVGSVAWITGGSLVVWLVVVLSAIYKWGTPVSIHRPLLSGFMSVALLVLGTWLASTFMPTLGSGSVAVLGTVGVVLVWAYYIGFVVIVVPAIIPPVEHVVRRTVT